MNINIRIYLNYLLLLALPSIFACGLLTPATGPVASTCIEAPDYGLSQSVPLDVYSDPTLTPSSPVISQTTATTGIYCTAVPSGPIVLEPTATPENDPYRRSSVENLTLNMGDAQTLDAAMNSNGSIIAWTEESDFLVLIDRKTYTDFSLMGWGSDGAVAFSPRGRAHVVYRDGPTLSFHYRASDTGEFMEDKPVEQVGSGSDPELLIDADGWAHLLFENNGDIVHRTQTATAWSSPPLFLRNHDKIEAILQDDGSLLAAATRGSIITLYRFDGASWTEQATLSHPHLVGEPRLDSDGAHSVIAFVTEEINTSADPAHGFNTVQAAYSPDFGQSWSSLREITKNEVGTQPSGRIAPPVFPIVAHHAKQQPRTNFLYIFEEGDPPALVPDALRFGKLLVTRCLQDHSTCFDDPPGKPPYDELSYFPSENLVLEVNPEHQTMIVGWTGLQIGEKAREVYSTFINPQSLAGD